MHSRAALWAVAILASTALAGCSGGGGGSGGSGGSAIDISEGADGTYTFTAKVSADSYTWDLGDRLTVKEGKTVTHTYDFENGNLTIRLSAGGEDYTRNLVLGDGSNREAAFVLEYPTNWAVTGEPFRLSAARSADPDGDPLRYSWNCAFLRAAERQPIHSHSGPVGGVIYGEPKPGEVQVGLAAGEMPAPDRVVEGDLCEGLGLGAAPSLDATIEGTFTQTGVYDIILLASDPKTASTSGRFTVYVTPPEERPPPIQYDNLTGTLQGGAGGTLQPVGDQADLVLDRTSHSFSLPLNAFNTTFELTFDAGAGGAQNVVQYAVYFGQGLIQEATGEDVTLSDLKAGSYTVQVTLSRGVDTDYTVAVATELNRDPATVY